MTSITEGHPRPEEAHNAHLPVGFVEAAATFLFVAGATHHRSITSIRTSGRPKEQMRRALANIKMVLDSKGVTWRQVVKLTKYLTDMRDMDDMYFRRWHPAGTLVAVNNLSAPGARIELDMIAVVPMAAACGGTP